MSFRVHERLLAGGFVAGQIDGCVVLLKNDRRFPWFVLVPEVAEKLEDLDQLDATRLAEVMSAVLKVSTFVRARFQPEKLNVGCIGNMVRQMHIHVVGRNPDDPAWPGVVWAHPGKEPYEEGEAEEILDAFGRAFLE